MKVKEIRAFSQADLDSKVKDLAEEYFKLRFQHGVRPLENTAKLQQLKKDIARIKTVIAERRIGQ